MDSHRPATSEALNHGLATTPRPSAAIILLRAGAPADGFELLLVRRSPEQRFMGGYWVFPGGAVDAGDGEGDAAHRAAAVRELREEASVGGIDPAELVAFSRWITPALLRIRFDTRFYLALAPVGARAHVDGRECVDLRWDAPRAFLDAQARGELPLAFPTLHQLEQLSGFASAERVLAAARAHEVRPTRPRAVLTGEVARLVLPGEPGYEDDAGHAPDSTAPAG